MCVENRLRGCCREVIDAVVMKVYFVILISGLVVPTVTRIPGVGSRSVYAVGKGMLM